MDRCARLVLLALLCGCAGPTRVARPPSPGRPVLTVMSYNVNYGIAGDRDTILAMGAGDPDVVFLQETTPGWEGPLRIRLRERFPYMKFHHTRGHGAGGLAVLSRLPFDGEAILPAPPGGWFPAWRLVLQTPLGPVQVLNVHLHPPFSDSGSVVSGYLPSRPLRRRELASYLAALTPGLPTLVVGDFNEDADGGAVRLLAARGLRSALPEFHPRRTTWRWPTAFGTLTAQLDHVAYSAELEPLDARVIEAGRSDHLPVLARFQRR